MPFTIWLSFFSRSEPCDFCYWSMIFGNIDIHNASDDLSHDFAHESPEISSKSPHVSPKHLVASASQLWNVPIELVLLAMKCNDMNKGICILINCFSASKAAKDDGLEAFGIRWNDSLRGFGGYFIQRMIDIDETSGYDVDGDPCRGLCKYTSFTAPNPRRNSLPTPLRLSTEARVFNYDVGRWCEE
ncbi:hypothetical protein F4804DRAFT_67698 [Jackrogersella minutella]|nr:hypothetical protein F4804DRAFT_67698 [Jackrogersella minutella]